MLVNLDSLPDWQADFTVKKRLKDSYEKYKTLQLTVSGFCDAALFTKMSYEPDGKQEEYILYEKKYTFDKNGEKTKLLFRKNIDVKEITYVD